MAISSNTLFRFMGKIDYLKSLLKKCNFEPRYCIEYDKKTKNGTYYAIPMVCFCDITLTQIKEHVDDYGRYGIGLSKKWAKEKVSPIIYYNNKSSLIHSLYDQLEEGMKTNQKTLFFALLKRYYGKTWSKKKKGIRNKVLYNEREWRYVPRTLSYERICVGVEDPKNFDVEAENRKLKGCNLEFSYDDIKYIIVNDESERTEIVKFLREEIKDDNTCSYLQSRILTLKQIKEDF